MINLLLGAPGGGKSYEAVVHHIIPALEKGRKVITNLPLRIEELEKAIPNCSALIVVVGGRGTVRAFSKAEDYLDTWRHPEKGYGPLYVIDECHKPLPRGGTSLAVEEWFGEHRHDFADVLLISQSYGKISKTIVDLIQTVYRVRKNIAFGSSKTYTRKVQDGIRGEVMNSSVRSYDKAYFRYYRSHTSNSGLDNEAEANDIVPIWKNWTFIGAAICALIVLGMFGSGKSKLNIMDTKPVSSAAAPKNSAQDTVAQKPQQVAKAVKEQVVKTIQGEPFDGFGLHIIGRTVWKGAENWFFSVSQNGMHVSAVSSRDLKLAGYGFAAIAPCIAKLTWQDKARYLLCDSPKMTIVPGGGSASPPPKEISAPDQHQPSGSEVSSS